MFQNMRMATLNLYVPDALKAQMDDIDGINWSQVAQAAFKAAIEEQGMQSTSDVTTAMLRMGKRPTRAFVPHNAASWRIIEAILDARGSASFRHLADAVCGHEGSSGGAFVKYCLKPSTGWLVVD